MTEALRQHRKEQLEQRMALGRPSPDALVFCEPDGSPINPRALSRSFAHSAARPIDEAVRAVLVGGNSGFRRQAAYAN